MDDFKWTEVSLKAALLIAKGDLAYQEIQDQLKIGRTTLWEWRQHPEFKARVDEILEDIRAEVKRVGIADTLRRVSRLNDRANRLMRVIEARADDPSMANVPGGTTGLIVRDVKGIGKGADFQIIDVYSVDTALTRELREHEKQAAQELGQWTDKVESNVTVAALPPIRIVEVGALPPRVMDAGPLSS